MAELKHWEDDKSLYLFTSLTSGSSHIVTATSRIETILKNARIPFTYIDTATNESAKKLFQRRARGKKLPLLVKEGFVIADLDEVEELNEFGELEETIGAVATTDTSITTAPATTKPLYQGTASGSPAPSPAPTSATPSSKAPTSTTETKKENAAPQQPSIMAQLAQESAAKAKEQAKRVPTPLTSKSSHASNRKATFKDKETPLSPNGIPLPESPAVKSPTVKPSTNSVSQQKHSSTGEHRGSQVAVATDEEIKRIESECSIAEENEEDEEDDDDESDSDEDEDEDSEEEESEVEEAAQPRTTPASKKADPLLTPIKEVATPLEEKPKPAEHEVGKEAATKPVLQSKDKESLKPAAAKSTADAKVDAKLAAKADALSIQEQEAAEGDNATKSVGD